MASRAYVNLTPLTKLDRLGDKKDATLSHEHVLTNPCFSEHHAATLEILVKISSQLVVTSEEDPPPRQVSTAPARIYSKTKTKF